ncbi:MAG: sulfotransferase domain-containing protein, partial [Gammaproteobacteria bacterium]
IVVATYAKSGTTWLQQILAQLIFNGEPDLAVADMSPWIDLRLPPRQVKLPEVEAQKHRRFVKTHLPVDALVYSPKAKYLYVGRDGRDVVWSFYNHHCALTDDLYDALNAEGGPGIEPLRPPDKDIFEYFHHWLETDGYPIWSFWENIATWWEIRRLPNLMLLHFSTLKDDLPGQIRQIAAFLEIPIDERKFDDILKHCSFDYMKENAEQTVPLGGAPFQGGAKRFIHKGTNGRWRETLGADDCDKYENIALEKLGPECAHWLATGELPD